MAKPVMLTVDDDPGVSRAVARDIRRRYGDDYRVRRMDSGARALEALRELKLRGDDVAVIIADHRMPKMTGVEFLEQAMDLYPYARRVLLTAYADTDAAIQAINVVDLDHYLLKPWDPPEVNLYPVLDALVEAWLRTERAGPATLRMVGDRWSARSHHVRDFLARNEVPYRWLLRESAEGARLIAAAAVEPAALPLVVTEDGTVLAAPTDGELAAFVGLSTSARQEFYDLVVIGAGPAGLGSAVYGASEGLRTVLVERHAAGGQAGTSSRIENYLGFPDGVSGAQLTDRARRQALRFGVELLAADVVGLAVRGSARVITCGDGQEIAAHTIILASGVSYALLAGAGLGGFIGRGVYYGAAVTEAPNCAGAEVYVVGGANAAGQAAMHFARYAIRVHLLVRADGLASSMSHYLVEQIAAAPGIDVHPHTEVVGAEGSDHLERLILRDSVTGETRGVDTQWLFVFIGAEPRTDWLDDVLERDAHGFVLTGPDLIIDGRQPRGWPLGRAPYHLETNVPGVFAAGDVRAESIKRVASAVGEGAMAVALAHRYLEQT